MPYHSPLRYPGGKGLMVEFVREVVNRSTHSPVTYVEPFAGGAAIAIGLLAGGDIETAVIGDADPAIAAFWRAATVQPDQLASRVAECDVTIDTWHEQAHIVAQGTRGDDLALGFAAFFLNRTNHSGILRARPIGGLHQNGRWPLDCRFNKHSLLKRLNIIADLADRIHVHEGDALKLLSRASAIDGSVFIYADPPYLTKSSDLYLDTMTYAAHQQLASCLRSSSASWMVSYDIDNRVANELYPQERILRFGLRHSAGRTHIGQELMAFSAGCVVTAATSRLRRADWQHNGSTTAAVLAGSPSSSDD